MSVVILFLTLNSSSLGIYYLPVALDVRSMNFFLNALDIAWIFLVSSLDSPTRSFISSLTRVSDLNKKVYLVFLAVFGKLFSRVVGKFLKRFGSLRLGICTGGLAGFLNSPADVNELLLVLVPSFSTVSSYGLIKLSPVTKLLDSLLKEFDPSDD